MRTKFLFLLIPVLFLGCARGAVRAEPDARLDRSSLRYNFEAFRLNRKQLLPLAYTVTNRTYLEALSNEFAYYSLSRETLLTRAADQYLSLTNAFPDQTAFLLQRAGICRFKLRDLPGANKYLSLALLSGAPGRDAGSELYFYRAMTLLYRNRDAEGALRNLKKINPRELDVDRQDLLVFEASAYAEMKDYSRAHGLYRSALNVNPERFYGNYDLTPFYRAAGRDGEIPQYVRSSFSALEKHKDPAFRVRAYGQLVEEKVSRGTDGLVYDFGLSAGYTYYPGMMYYYDHPRPMDRIKSFFLQTPLKDRRSYRSERIYYTVFEDYLDGQKESRVLLVQALMDVTNIRHPFSGVSDTLTRTFATNTTLLLLSPTNIFLVLTNSLVATNARDRVLTNQSNVILTRTLNFPYYITTEYCDLDRDGKWEYLFLGFDRTNTVTALLFNPDTLRFAGVKFPVRSAGAKLVIQDVNGNGRNDVVLLDDDVYFLKLEPIP